ncbi:metallophosphoesterase family protein [Eremococcus coleocola]|uniref:Ser/Thr phosphatase family protein n=1 Tax=Eremococcus coleocola ACS-139-V-Col8 TaxID=908337 RepID=E4KM83_9LACT|nr:metallophosphoesterase [Eremococcus coleocola]EFR32125.1 Ser/Thr phosphatase family protein [Eremococcus coleocola ACS-139-V-Col8]
MKFLHLSDTHLRQDYASDWFTHRIFTDYDNPTIRFRHLLASINPVDYDFAIVTGDLCHEGEASDYGLFRSLWQEHLGDLPYFFCRGNHDPGAAFAEGMQVEMNLEGSYIACHEFKGLRIIILDSYQEGDHEGAISEAQFQQLKTWLSKPAEKGSILIQHHPLAWEEPDICTRVPQGFAELIASSDIRAIFVGHVHTASVVTYQGINQYMSEAISFGVDEYDHESIFTNRTGYNSVTLTSDQIFYYRHYLTPHQSMIARMAKPFDNSIF